MSSTNMMGEQNGRDELKDILFNPCVEFAFGPFRVTGNFSDIGDIVEGISLYQMGFRKLQTIQDVQIGSTRAVLLYHKEEKKDVVILIPEKFPSWRLQTAADDMLIIIEGMQIVDTNHGFITQETPNHLALQGSTGVLHPYTLTYTISGYNLTGTGIDRCHFNPNYQLGIVGLTCSYGEDRTKYVMQEKADSTDFLVHRYIDLVAIRKSDHRPNNLEPHSLGTLIQRFDPPTVPIVDRDTPWTESYELCELASNDLSIGSNYSVTRNAKDSYQCKFQETGLLLSRIGNSSVNVAEVLKAVGMCGGLSVNHQFLWLTLNAILNMIGFNEYPAPTAKITYQKVDRQLINRIDPENDDFAEYGFEILPRTGRVSAVDMLTRISEEMSVTLQSVTCLITLPPEAPNQIHELEDFLYHHNDMKLYFMSNYLVKSLGSIKSWSRTKLNVVWSVFPQINLRTGDIHFKICGTIRRATDRKWLAKVSMEMPTVMIRDISVYNGTNIPWIFNVDLLTKESADRKDRNGYINNFISTMNAMGVSTATTFYQLQGDLRKLSIPDNSATQEE